MATHSCFDCKPHSPCSPGSPSVVSGSSAEFHLTVCFVLGLMFRETLGIQFCTHEIFTEALGSTFTFVLKINKHSGARTSKFYGLRVNFMDYE